MSRYSGYADEMYVLCVLAAHILLTAFSAIGEERVLAGLEKYLSPEHQPACYAFIDEWNASAEQEKLLREFEKLSEEQGKSGIFDKVKKAMGME